MSFRNKFYADSNEPNQEYLRYLYQKGYIDYLPIKDWKDKWIISRKNFIDECTNKDVQKKIQLLFNSFNGSSDYQINLF